MPTFDLKLLGRKVQQRILPINTTVVAVVETNLKVKLCLRRFPKNAPFET